VAASLNILIDLRLSQKAGNLLIGCAVIIFASRTLNFPATEKFHGKEKSVT
jgi:hypothetical protein